ncbi:hypothetical protein ACNOYE_29190 [Nannocystaceae bacterium ST9]
MTMHPHPDLELVPKSQWRGHTAFYVGWLGGKEPFATGVTPSQLVEKLSEFDDMSIYMRGLAPCPRCDEVIFVNRGEKIPLGQSHILIPWHDHWYFAPDLIIHHIQAHGYCPPDAFVQAALATSVNSIEYKLALLRLFRSDPNLHPGQAPWTLPFAETQALWRLLDG